MDIDIDGLSDKEKFELLCDESRSLEEFEMVLSQFEENFYDLSETEKDICSIFFAYGLVAGMEEAEDRHRELSALYSKQEEN